MGPESIPTELFRDLWLTPVDSVELLPPPSGPGAMCFVIAERRVYVVIDGQWIRAPRKAASS
jgi:hypothetical protein